MLPVKYSFRLLKREKAKQIRLDLKSKKRSIIISEVKENIEQIENLEDGNKKRLFLKLAGMASVGAVAYLFAPKKAEALIFGSTPASNVVGAKDSNNNRIDPAQETGGHLANIDTGLTGHSADIDTNTTTIATNTTPFVTSGAGAYVRQDSINPLTATMALETGGNLASIAANTSQLGSLSFSNGGLQVAVSGTVIAGDVKVQDITGTRMNPASEESIFYLRRMTKLLESNAAVDSGNRQRISLDAVNAGITVPVSATLNNIATLASQNQQMFQDPARTAYATGIRQNLSW